MTFKIFDDRTSEELEGSISEELTEWHLDLSWHGNASPTLLAYRDKAGVWQMHTHGPHDSLKRVYLVEEE